MKDARGTSRGGHRIDGEAVALAAASKALQNRQAQEAIRLLQPWVERRTASAEILVMAARAQMSIGLRRPAVVLLDRAIAAGAGASAYLLKGKCLAHAGKTDDACAALRKAIEDPTHRIEASCMLAYALENAGRIEEAQLIIEPLVAEMARSGKIIVDVSFAWARILSGKKQFDESDAQLSVLLADLGSTQPQMRNFIWYLRAKNYDRTKRYDEAMHAAMNANMIGELDFDPAAHTRQTSAAIEQWTPQRMKLFPQSGCKSDIPVFVAGMPRSGTSLIDQIVDAHPDGAGVGELAHIENFARRLNSTFQRGIEPPECFGANQESEWTRVANEYLTEITARAPTAKRIVNKALGNTQILWLIASLFPLTRIIHVIRDPRDVAISCLMGGFNNRLHPWTTRMEWIACAWQESQRMMNHWKASLPVPILDVSYEQLVQHPEIEFPRILNFLGMEWDEACTRFHESKRTVRTLSYDQVNRPLYTSSVARHVNYAKSLQGIRWPEYDPTAL